MEGENRRVYTLLDLPLLCGYHSFFVTSQSSWHNSAVTTDLFLFFFVVQFIDCQAPGAASFCFFYYVFFTQVTFPVLFAQPWLQAHALTSQLLGHTKMKHTTPTLEAEERLWLPKE